MRMALLARELIPATVSNARHHASAHPAQPLAQPLSRDLAVLVASHTKEEFLERRRIEIARGARLVSDLDQTGAEVGRIAHPELAHPQLDQLAEVGEIGVLGADCI